MNTADCRKKLQKGNYFTLNKKLAIELMISNTGCDLICCWLILAKNSNRYNDISYASVDSVSKILGIGRDRAKSILNQLVHLESWSPIRELHGNYEALNRKKQYFLNQYQSDNSECIYFSNEIVGNKSDKKNPISSIFRSDQRDCLIRALLIAHLTYSPIYCSVPPSIVCLQSHAEKSKNYNLLYYGTATVGGNYYPDPSAVRVILGTYNDGNDTHLTASEIKKVDQIYKWLTENGFLRKSIVVYSSRAGRPLYEIDLKGAAKKSSNICRTAEELIRSHGLEAGRGASPPYRFYDRYPVIAPLEHEPFIVGLYRPTYYPSCSSIDIVQQSEDQKTAWQKNAENWFSQAHEQEI